MSFGSARMQCTAAGRSPEDCRDPRVLGDILGKYYPSKYWRGGGGREGGRVGWEGREEGEMCWSAISVQLST